MLQLNLVEERVYIDIDMVCGFSLDVNHELHQVLMKWGEWKDISDSEHNRKELKLKFNVPEL